MAKGRKMFVFSPPKKAKPKLPNAVKANVTAKANDLVDTALKPTHVKPPAGDERFNYIVDIYSKWYRNYFHFCSKYACRRWGRSCRTCIAFLFIIEHGI
jgi:hypothetical protein